MVLPRLDVNDEHGRRVVPVDKDPFTIGRRIGSDLHLTNGDVSRVHAEITAVDDGFRLCDRGSRHGTFVNDEAITEHRLAHGDRVRLGHRDGAEFVFLSNEDAAEAASSERAAVGEMHQVAVLLEGLRALSSGQVLDDVLAMVVDSAIAVSRAERGFIMLAGDDDRLEFKLGRSRDQSTLPGTRSRPAGRSRRRSFARAARASRPTCSTATSPISTWAPSPSASATSCGVPLRLLRHVEANDAAAEDGASACSTSTAARRATCCRPRPARPSTPWPPRRRWPSTTRGSTGPRSRRRGSTRRWPRRPRYSRPCCRRAAAADRTSMPRRRCCRASR